MFIHNLTVALRNLTKYKTQSIVSILGLAASFACFSLTAVWMRYENSFDRCQPKGNRIYRIVIEDKERETGFYEFVPGAMADYLKSNFPEVEDASLEKNRRITFGTGENKATQIVSSVDNSFIRMFDLPQDLIKQLHPLESGRIPVALNQESVAWFLRNNMEPIGLQSEPEKKQYEIRSIFPTWKSNSEVMISGFMFDNQPDDMTWNSKMHLYVLLKEGVSKKAFIDKIKNLKIEQMSSIQRGALMAVPLHEMHKVMHNDFRGTKYQHIRIFSFASGIAILCAIFNYLVLFITRLKMRGRELALRKIHGASGKSLMGTLLWEFGLVLTLALLVGEYLVKISRPFFQKVSYTFQDPNEIYLETLMFGIILFIGTILLCAVPIYYFRHKTLREHLNGKYQGGIRNLFQKVILVVQLLISTLMILATTVLYMQIGYLKNQGMGFSTHNVYSLCTYSDKVSDMSLLVKTLNQLPYVEKVIPVWDFIFPNPVYTGSSEVEQENVANKQKDSIKHYYVDSRFFDMFEIKLLEGRIFHPDETQEVVLNASARKLFGKRNIIGTLTDGHPIVGVVSDSYFQSPLLPSVPTMFRNIKDKKGISEIGYIGYKDYVVFKLKETAIPDSTLKIIYQIAKKEYPEEFFSYREWERTYNGKIISSERKLTKLFSIVSIICLLISIFGIYSLASLTCEQRRKEIAIRKINGATMKDILNLFFKEFFILLGIAIVIAFPIGYYVMHLWLEQYSRQVPMGPLLFLGIALALALVIVLTIIFRVWRAASANPAQVIKENN